MKKFKIIYDEPGQSCNRFWSYIASISWALENNAIVYVLFWDHNFKDFDQLFLNNKLIKFPFYKENLWNFHIRSFFPYRSLFSRTIGHPFMRKMYRKWYYDGEKYNFVSGWKTRGSANYIRYREVFKTIFRPNDDIVREIDTFFNGIHESFDFVIGVHIRRGDYREYRNGIYYYSHTQYREKMLEMEEVYKKQKNVCFFIASNERVPLDVFKGLNVFYIPENSTAADLYALSKCDRLIGPSSTFTRWVSFIENIPLYYIFDIQKRIDNDQLFSPILDFYHFKNGESLPF